MKTYKGKLGEYIIEDSSDEYWDSFSLYKITVNKPNWFNKLFPYFRISYSECHGYGFMGGFGEYEQFVNANNDVKDQMIQKQIETFERRSEEKKNFSEKLKETNEYLNS